MKVDFEWQVGKEERDAEAERASIRKQSSELDARFFGLFFTQYKRLQLIYIVRSLLFLLVAVLAVSGVSPSVSQIEHHLITQAIYDLEVRKAQALARGEPVRRYPPLTAPSTLMQLHARQNTSNLPPESQITLHREVLSTKRTGNLITARMSINEPVYHWRLSGPFRIEPFRITYFFEETEHGLQTTVPQAEFWGIEQRLETANITFIFSEPDADVVTAVAPQLENALLYLYQLVGKNPDMSSKADTQLTIAWQPRLVNQELSESHKIQLISPELVEIPAQFTDQEYIRQVALSWLVFYVVEQTLDQHTDRLIEPEWEMALWGLRSWLRRQVNHEFGPLQALDDTIHLQLDATLWRLLENSPDLEPSCVSSWCDELIADKDRFMAQVLLEESLFDYIVARYGEEQLPNVIDGMTQFGSWEALGQVVFGESIEGFE
ncbi:MAG: hypothetical protein AAF702_21070 [Chloroflexota bacterium]